MATGINNTSFTERQLVTFKLGEDEFGADIMDVKEIIRVPDITRVPNAPGYVEGACNLRGNVLPIIDGRTRFNLERKQKDENSRVLVIDVEGKATGIIVDKVSEVMRVNTADIETPPQILKNVDSDYLSGIVKLDNGNRLVMLLDVVKALNVESTGEDRMNGQSESWHNNTMLGTGTESIEEEQLVSFLLDKVEYAIGIMKVKEIIRAPQIVKIPNCAAYIEGVVSIRNNLLPIINLRTYFGMGHLDVNDYTRILVVDMGNFTAGIMVDKVLEVLRVPTSIIQLPPKFSAQSGEQLKGVAKLNNGKRMILILEPSNLISDEEINEIEINGIENNCEEDVDEESVAKQVLDEEQVVTFKINAEEYGIKIANVQEINRMTEVTKIPMAPYYIEGIVNLRGNIIPVLDLRRLFNFPEKQITDATRIIIVDFNGKRTGIVVDSVSEVLRFEKTLIETPPDVLSNGIDSDYVEGVGKLDGGNRMILILNISRVLSFS